MFDALLIALVLVILFLGFRLFMKFRDISSWERDEDDRKASGRPSLPKELGDLKIETPPLDAFDSLDSPEGHDPSGGKPRPGDR